MSEAYRVHVENLTAQHPLFHVTPERWSEAAACHPTLTGRIDVSYGWDLAEFPGPARDARAIVGWRLPWRELREACPDLEWIHMTGAGIEQMLPFDWVWRGLVLTNSSGVHAREAGEYVTMALLMLNAEIPALVEAQRARRWEKRFTATVAGKRLLVLGAGAMGRTAARAARRLGLHVAGVRASGRPARWFDEMHRTDALDHLLPGADFVLVAVPATPATRDLMDCRRLRRMKPGASLINMGRAGVVDHEALAEMLAEGHLSGAILDVFDPEPLPVDSAVWDMPNAMLTPHVSSDDPEHYATDVVDLFLDNLERRLAGRRLRNRIRPERGY